MTARVFPDPFPPACATAWGDDRYGLWCEITVKGVVQRLRWIEPGAFWMGSAEEKQGLGYTDRINEVPRHCVRLTNGFWLADTACTQALWQVVVGSNPSGFRGDELPVEEMSWNDVLEKFITKINHQLGSGRTFLPTEAQWEYACRAGTTTTYEFGGSFDRMRVNTGSQKTVPVRALQPNRWGLYQMYGNVWEWCADAPRTYTEEFVIDPDGGQNSPARALRGGSWNDGPQATTCAARAASDFRRVVRYGRTGFRFALVSV